MRLNLTTRIPKSGHAAEAPNDLAAGRARDASPQRRPCGLCWLQENHSGITADAPAGTSRDNFR